LQEFTFLLAICDSEAFLWLQQKNERIELHRGLALINNPTHIGRQLARANANIIYGRYKVN